jgi:DNA-binding CsgD family transcriptional regulator
MDTRPTPPAVYTEQAFSPDSDSAEDALIEPLTRRERDILRLLAQGYSGPEIAENLVLALSTVKSYIQHLYGKLGAHKRREALARARALGLLGASGPAIAVTVGETGGRERQALGAPRLSLEIAGTSAPSEWPLMKGLEALAAWLPAGHVAVVIMPAGAAAMDAMPALAGQSRRWPP